MESNKTKKRFDVLGTVERVGNALPHPAVLFALFCLALIVISQIMASMGISVTYDSLVDGTLQATTVGVQSLLSADGIRYMFTNAVTNFGNFAPLAMVLVATLGVGVAEKSGMIDALLTKVVTSTPSRLITVVVVFAGVMSSIASDAGYVVLIPLGAVVFLSFGRHPLAGIAAAFAGVSGGFSANLFPGPVDATLAGLTSEATGLSIQGFMEVGITDNLFFMIASTLLITVVGTIVTERIVEPRLGEYTGKEVSHVTGIDADAKRGLRFAGIAAVIYAAIIAYLTLPANAILRDPSTGDLMKSPFMSSIVVVIVLFFLIPGIAYGFGSRRFKKSDDVIDAMTANMKTMASYIVLVFFAAQFIGYFSYTKIGTVVAVTGSNILQNAGADGIFLIIGFVIVVAIINIFMGSASAKWAILAPVFVPMLMNLGYNPALVQMAYRIGDSTTNIISPLMSYFALIVAFTAKYDENAKAGTLVTMMLPYSLFLLIGWIVLLLIFFIFKIPLGPGVMM
ncbi:MAG: AbgT family transporter [Erysipelotrichaceae bacterium]